MTRLTLLLLPALLYGATPTSITVTSSRNPATLGHAITLTATVSPTTATGSVTFYEGTAVLETEPLVNGKATYTTDLLPFGTLPLTAYYLGNSTYAPSLSAAVPQTVNTVMARAFLPAVTYTTGLYEESIAQGDFNGDGKPDLAVTNNESSTVSVLLGNGDGTFQAPVDYSVPVPVGIATGDFNGDGKADLAVANVDGYATILLGNGDGTFQAATNYGGDFYPNWIEVADFNGDGNADLVMTAGNELVVLLGNGDGSFQTPLYTDVSCFLVAVGDFNGDGKPNVAISGYGDSLGVLLGKGDGTFQPVASYPITAPDGSWGVAVSDFNGDGKPDIAITGTEYGVNVLLGNGDGTFQAAAEYVPGGPPYWVASADFNGDGKADLVMTWGGDVSIMLGNGDGTFQPYVNYPGSCSQVVLGDFNGDGRTDVAAIDLWEPSTCVLLGTKAGLTTTTLTSSVNPSHYGQNVTFTASISSSTATGTVIFYHGTSELGAGTVKDGEATFTTSTLSAGDHSLTAAYGGDANDQASTSAALTQVVLTGPTSTTLYSSPNPSPVGQTVTLVAKVTPSAATGTVTFSHGSIAIGTAAVVDGTATLGVSTLSKGAHSITASYGGSTTYAPSVSEIVTQVVE